MNQQRAKLISKKIPASRQGFFYTSRDDGLKVVYAGILLVIFACLPATFNSKLEAGFVYFFQGKGYVLHQPLHNVAVVNVAFVTKISELVGKDESHLLCLLQAAHQEHTVKAVLIVKYIKHLIQLYGTQSRVIILNVVSIFNK